MDGPDLVGIAAGIDFQIPTFDTEAWLQLIILVISLILCATASAAETALTSVRTAVGDERGVARVAGVE